MKVLVADMSKFNQGRKSIQVILKKTTVSGPCWDSRAFGHMGEMCAGSFYSIEKRAESQGWGDCSVGKCLLSKHEDLSSGLQHLWKSRCGAGTCNPSTGSMEKSGPAFLVQLVNSGSQRDPVSKTKVERN